MIQCEESPSWAPPVIHLRHMIGQNAMKHPPLGLVRGSVMVMTACMRNRDMVVADISDLI